MRRDYLKFVGAVISLIVISVSIFLNIKLIRYAVKPGVVYITRTDTCYLELFAITDHKKYQIAIAMTESELNQNAIGKTNDFGVFQVTPVWCAEVNRILGEERYTHTDAFSVKKSCEMWEIMYKDLSLDNIIKKHNPGAGIAYRNKVYNNLQKVEVICEMLNN